VVGTLLLRLTLLSCVACAGSEAEQRKPPRIRRAEEIAVPTPPPAEPPPAATAPVKVKGLTGTLNPDDVHQTMDARQPAFDACIDMSRRSLRWVSGAIRFAFRVGADGAVEEVHPIESTIGHRVLEECLASAVAETQFPKPAGRATAQFDWGMSIEPAKGAPAAQIEPKLMQRVLQRQAPKLFTTCEVRRRRERFQVTAYIAPGGRVLSAGAVPIPPRAAPKVDCVLEQVASWHMPKVDRSGKVSFELR
jgi:hypothetical protein